VKVAADGKSLDPSDVKWITGPYDEYALEEAIRIKEAGGGEVIALSVGPDSARDVLKNALALGADSAVLLKGHPGGDPLAAARMIAGYAEGKGFDLILMGNKGIGDDNCAVGPMVAELLGWGQANVVVKLELKEGRFQAERENRRRHGAGGRPPACGDHRPEGPQRPALRQPQGHHGRQEEDHRGNRSRSGGTAHGHRIPFPAPGSSRRPEARRRAAGQARELLTLLRDEAKVF